MTELKRHRFDSARFHNLLKTIEDSHLTSASASGDFHIDNGNRHDVAMGIIALFDEWVTSRDRARREVAPTPASRVPHGDVPWELPRDKEMRVCVALFEAAGGPVQLDPDDLASVLHELSSARGQVSSLAKQKQRLQVANGRQADHMGKIEKKRKRLQREVEELRQGIVKAALDDQRAFHNRVIAVLRDAGVLGMDGEAYDAWLGSTDANSKEWWTATRLLKYPAEPDPEG